MRTKGYEVRIKESAKVIEVTVTSTNPSFTRIKDALTEVKPYIAKGFKVVVRGYFRKRNRVLDAFLFALSLVGKGDLVVFEGRARYTRKERRELRDRARVLRARGYTVKRISEELKIPLKTVYRWVKN